MNPFKNTYKSLNDNALIEQILNGDQLALTELLEKHQTYIYNIAWKMTGNISDAEDLTQDALIKIISNLKSFKMESSFQTWAFRIVKNHFLNHQIKPSNIFSKSFEELGEHIDNSPNKDLNENELIEQNELIRELRLTCLSGMLLCLTREQRLVYIIGEIFGADHNIGSEIMELSKDNYRMKLSKARKDLYNFMQNKCGLVNKENPCRCHKKVTFASEMGMINAKNLLYNKKEFSTFRAQLEPDANFLVEDSELKIAELHQDHSYKTHFEKKKYILNVLDNSDWQKRLNLN